MKRYSEGNVPTDATVNYLLTLPLPCQMMETLHRDLPCADSEEMDETLDSFKGNGKDRK